MRDEDVNIFHNQDSLGRSLPPSSLSAGEVAEVADRPPSSVGRRMTMAAVLVTAILTVGRALG
ncbi:MAG: hypothetical protein ACUVX8_10520, partial [Candidatus Zipacnadales bacterium]